MAVNVQNKVEKQTFMHFKMSYIKTRSIQTVVSKLLKHTYRTVESLIQVPVQQQCQNLFRARR